MNVLRALVTACLAVLWFGLSGAAWSQTTRTIKIVVPFPAGGSATILARLLADEVGRAHGHTMLIENRPALAPRSRTKPWRAPRPTATPW